MPLERCIFLVLSTLCLCGCPDVDKYAKNDPMDVRMSDGANKPRDGGVNGAEGGVSVDMRAAMDMGDGFDGMGGADRGVDVGTKDAKPIDALTPDVGLDGAPTPRVDSGSSAPEHCRVVFRVELPMGAPSEMVFLAGTGFGTPDWMPGDAALQLMVVDGVGGFEQDAAHLNRLVYKYTRGTWDTVERTQDCTEISNRSVVVNCAAGQAFMVNDTVLNWADLCD